MWITPEQLERVRDKQPGSSETYAALGLAAVEIERLQVEWCESEGAERCQDCGRRYLVVWKCSDELWRKITGRGEAGLLCPMCFDKRCRGAGIHLHWEAFAHSP